MEENKIIQQEAETEVVQEQPTEESTEEKKNKAEEAKKIILEKLEERKAKIKTASEVMKEGRGVLKLETVLRSQSKDVTELAYDFTELTGMEYIDAMDADPNVQSAFSITNRQALALFAQAAAKKTPGMGMRDIMEQIGGTDAVEAVELAMLFFHASKRAGQLRISKMPSQQE